MKPFEPIGEEPRWRTIYRLLSERGPGDVLTYEEMAEALMISPDSRHIMQSAIRRAAREFEKFDKQSIEAVPNKGYRVLRAPEHLDLARAHQRKSNRSLDRGHSTTVNVDLSGLDPETRKAFGLVAQAFAAQMDFNRRMDVRQRHLEEAVGRMKITTERTEDEITELRARLDRLERGA